MIINLAFQVKIDEQERLIRELENTLQRTGVETDRRLTQQQRDSEQKVQMLMHQLAEGASGVSADASLVIANEAKYVKNIYLPNSLYI